MDESSSWEDSVELTCSHSETETTEMQSEILRRSRALESLIKKEGPSAAMDLLKSLFILFKSELALNLELRKRIVREKKENAKTAKAVEAFFETVRNDGFSGMATFGDVVNHLNESRQNGERINQKLEKAESRNKQLKREGRDRVEASAERERTMANHLERTERMCKRENGRLRDALAVAEKENRTLEQKYDNAAEEAKAVLADKERIEAEAVRDATSREAEIMKLKKMVATVKSVNISVNRENAELRVTIAKQAAESECLKSRFDELQKRAAVSEADIELLKGQVNEKSTENQCLHRDLAVEQTHAVEMKHKREERNAAWQDRVAKLEDGNARLRKVLIEHDRRRTKECEQQAAEQTERDEIIAEGQRENVRLQCQIEEFDRVLGETREELERMRTVSDTARRECVRLQGKIKQSMCETHEMEKTVVAKKKLIRRMRTVQCQQEANAEAKVRAEREAVEREWTGRYEQYVSRCGDVEEELRAICRERESEVESLKDTVRRLSFSLEREEADNARLHAQGVTRRKSRR